LYTSEEKAIFVKAKNLGIHRTVHAGEDGPASNVVIVCNIAKSKENNGE
jgi:hypothetical protein